MASAMYNISRQSHTFETSGFKKGRLYELHGSNLGAYSSVGGYGHNVSVHNQLRSYDHLYYSRSKYSNIIKFEDNVNSEKPLKITITKHPHDGPKMVFNEPIAESKYIVSDGGSKSTNSITHCGRDYSIVYRVAIHPYGTNELVDVTFKCYTGQFDAAFTPHRENGKIDLVAGEVSRSTDFIALRRAAKCCLENMPSYIV